MKAKFLVNRFYTPISPYMGTSAIKDELLSHGYLVVMDQGIFQGILTSNDLIKSPYNLVLDCIRQRPAIDENDPIDYVFDCMKSSGFKVLPVFSGERFVGVVRQYDIADYLSEYRTELEKKIQAHTAELKKVNAQLMIEEEALRASEEKYRVMMEAMTDPLVICSSTRTLLYQNPAMMRRLGRDATGEPCFRAIHGLENQCDWCVLDDVTQGQCLERTVVSPKDNHHYTISHMPIQNKNGSTSLMAIFRDITDYVNALADKEKAMIQLQQVQKMEAIGTLAGGIAHDFNNILGVITGYVSDAVADLHQGDTLYEVLNNVLSGTRQAQTLTRQLLTFAKGGAPVKHVADLNQLIKESTTFSLRGARSGCHFELSDDLWSAEVDAGQFNQVIGNMIINANQAMPLGGIIRVSSENTEIASGDPLPLLPGRYVKITIEDQGEGIREKDLLNIFEPFFTTKQSGSGLGLATSYSIVKRHGGHIIVDSELNRGTRFQIFFPASSKKVALVSEQKERHHHGAGHILVMDDQEMILNMMGKMLNHLGYEISFATHGAQAIDMYRQAYLANSPYSLVILDLTVPGGMDGAETMAEILKINPDAKGVVSSGYSNDPIMADYAAYGFCGVIPKPFTRNQMVDLLNTIFEPQKCVV